jgi:hypothetical protein
MKQERRFVMDTNLKKKITTMGFRWLARITSLLSVGMLSLFLFGEPFNGARITSRELVGLAFFPAGVAIGLIIAWWKEGLGAAISLVSLLAFYIIFGWLLGSNVKGPYFVLFASPAFLFLIAWLLSKRNFSEVHA